MDFTKLLINIQKIESVCYCPLHRGDMLQQLEGQLATNHRPVIILKDRYGFHVDIGAPNQMGYPTCPPAVTETEVEQMLLAALRG